MNEDGSSGTGEEAPVSGDADGGVPTRRMLMLGAAGASMVVTIRPALAQTAGSVLACKIPIPQPRENGQWIAGDGSVVPPLTKGAVRPPIRPLKGEDVRQALRNNTTFPGTSHEQTQAYTAYMQRLQNGNSGFTCFVSLKTR